MSPRRRPPKASPPAPIDLNPRDEAPLDFPTKSLSEMTADDYAAIGFMCGLEVHQQLATEQKLFCRCPNGVRTTTVDSEVLRHMRPTLSEMGQYDGTALMEFKTKKDIVYLLERESVCTYEIDDTPPFPINEEAVRNALGIAASMGMNLVSELQVMRKQYLDGSIPTGFQRTAVVGVGGSVPLRDSELGPGRELRLRQLTLEEDSCREVSDVGHTIRFRTDRLGVPLIETVTEPDLLVPGDVARGGRWLARVARASGQVLRGAGSARQDVNVSIAGSRRVEIKGVPSHRWLPKLVHTEAFRQLELLRLRAALIERGVTMAALEIEGDLHPYDAGWGIDAGSMLRDCGYAPIVSALDLGYAVGAVRLPGFAGLTTWPTQTGCTFIDELADRLRVISCIEFRPCLVTTDQPEGPGESTWRELRKALHAEDDDAVALVWGSPEDVESASDELLIRCREALIGVPPETRQAFIDGRTGFERVLPGPERMYPDTDTPPLAIPDAWIEANRARHIELPWDREDRYVSAGLSVDAARRVMDAPWCGLFDRLLAEDASNPAIAPRLARGLERAGAKDADPERLAPFVRATENGTIRPEGLEVAIEHALRTPAKQTEDIIRSLAPIDEAERDRRIAELVAEAVAPRRGLGAYLRYAMGRLMHEMRGRVDGAELRARVAAAIDRPVPETTA